MKKLSKLKTKKSPRKKSRRNPNDSFRNLILTINNYASTGSFRHPEINRPSNIALSKIYDLTEKWLLENK